MSEESSAEKHPLETPWSFWVDRKQLAKYKKEDEASYLHHVQCLGSCDTVEDFFSFYTHLVRAYDLPKNTNFYFFRHEKPPTWESYPDGGSWIVKIKRESWMLARLWEKLLFSAVGETLDEPDIVGLVLSIRHKEDVISVWNADASNRFRVADKLKRVLRLGANALMEYKTNAAALQDHSSYRNANKFLVEEDVLSPPPTPPLSLRPPSESKLAFLERIRTESEEAEKRAMAQPKAKRPTQASLLESSI